MDDAHRNIVPHPRPAAVRGPLGAPAPPALARASPRPRRDRGDPCGLRRELGGERGAGTEPSIESHCGQTVVRSCRLSKPRTKRLEVGSQFTIAILAVKKEKTDGAHLAGRPPAAHRPAAARAPRTTTTTTVNGLHTRRSTTVNPSAPAGFSASQSDCRAVHWCISLSRRTDPPQS